MAVTMVDERVACLVAKKVGTEAGARVERRDIEMDFQSAAMSVVCLVVVLA